LFPPKTGRLFWKELKHKKKRVTGLRVMERGGEREKLTSERKNWGREMRGV